jgi:hypothetical protein
MREKAGNDMIEGKEAAITVLQAELAKEKRDRVAIQSQMKGEMSADRANRFIQGRTEEEKVGTLLME